MFPLVSRIVPGFSRAFPGFFPGKSPADSGGDGVAQRLRPMPSTRSGRQAGTDGTDRRIVKRLQEALRSSNLGPTACDNDARFLVFILDNFGIF